MQPNRRKPCRYGRFVRRRISSASARRDSYSRSCADLHRPPRWPAVLRVAAGDGDGDGLRFGAAAGHGEVVGGAGAVGMGEWWWCWVLPPSDLLRWRRSLRNPPQRREPRDDEDDVDEAEDAVDEDEDEDERDAAGVTAAACSSSAAGSRSGA